MRERRRNRTVRRLLRRRRLRLIRIRAAPTRQTSPISTNARQIQLKGTKTGTIVTHMVSMCPTTIAAVIAQSPGQNTTGRRHATTSWEVCARGSTRLCCPAKPGAALSKAAPLLMVPLRRLQGQEINLPLSHSRTPPPSLHTPCR